MAILQPCALPFGLDGSVWEQHQLPFTEVGGGESGWEGGGGMGVAGESGGGGWVLLLQMMVDGVEVCWQWL